MECTVSSTSAGTSRRIRSLPTVISRMSTVSSSSTRVSQGSHCASTIQLNPVNVHTKAFTWMFYFFDIGQSRNVPINLTNVPQYTISRKTVHWEPSFSMPMDRLRLTWRSWGQLSNKQHSYLYVTTNVGSEIQLYFIKH